MTSEVERLAAACIFPGFAGVEPPDWVRRWIERGVGGVVLFARNVEGPDQVARLTAALRADREDVVVATDEEGGDVTRLEARAGSSYPGCWALGVVDDESLTEEVAQAIGGDLARVGINLDLAPVADVNSNPANPVIGIRSFGPDHGLVARHVAAFVAGLQRGGVSACVKHFPGHGDTFEDSHVSLPTVRTDRDTLLAETLVPFRAAIDAGTRAVMTAHIRVPTVDAVPATVSRAILTDLLRGELGFDGVVMTDALEMRGLSATVGVEEGAVLALAAGADALCLGADIDEDDVARVHAAVLAAVRAGRLDETRLAEAAGRVSGLPPARPGPRPHADVGLEAARRALNVEGAVEVGAAPFVLELRPEPMIAVGVAGAGLGDVLRARAPATQVSAAVESDPPWEPGGDGSLVIVVRDAHRYPWERAAVERVLAARDAVVVETGIPLWRPAGASGYVATQGAGRVNLEAAAERLVPGVP